MKYIAKKREDIKSERTPFLKLYTDDWIAGTIELSFEEKGFYFEVLLRMWERKGTLPDDANWLACALGCNPRTVRKLVSRLTATSHLQVKDGVISNRRMMREISQHLAKHQPQLEVNSTPIQPEFDANSTGTTAKKPTKSTNEKTLPEAIFQIPEPEEKKKQASPVSEAEVLAGDLSEQMVEDISKWAGMPKANSRQWLGETVATFGQRPVSEAYHSMKTKKNEGMIVSRPLAFWSKLAKEARDSAERGKTAKQAPWVEERLAGQRDALQIAAEMGYA